MALNKNKTTTNFEEVPNEDGADEGQETTATQTPKERLQAEADARAAAKAETKTEDKSASTERAVAPAGKPNQVAALRAMVDPFETLKNVFPVEFDTLCNIQLNQGNAINKDTDTTLGEEIGLELISYQDQTVVSPGVDGDEAKEHVRYSDDGVTTTKDGENVHEYLARLKANGYEEAKLSQRVIIVGSLFDPGSKGMKIKGMKDKLVQINLAPSSVSGFKRYRADQAFKIGKGLAGLEGVNRIRITCSVKKNGNNSYTVGEFTRYDDAAE